MTNPSGRAEVVVDLDAIAANTAVLRERVGRPLMAVVKADGYGHGLVPAARAVLAGGADHLGVAVLEEALALRAAGITAPLLSWLHGPGTDFAAALTADVEVSVNAEWSLAEVVDAASVTGRTARLHLFVDTGLSREGATTSDWPRLVQAAARAQADGHLVVVGLWSHMAYADAPTHPTIGAQVRVFEEAVAIARAAGLTDARLHLANSAATVALPGHLVRHGAARDRALRPRSARRPGPDRARAAAGHDRPGGRRAGQAGAGGRRGLLRPHLLRRARDDARPGAGRLRRRRAPRRWEPRAGARRRKPSA